MHSGVTVSDACDAEYRQLLTDTNQTTAKNCFWPAMKYLTELIISNSWPAAGDICHFNRRRRRPSKNEKLISGCFPLCFRQWKADWKNSRTVPVWACSKFCRVRCQSSQSHSDCSSCMCLCNLSLLPSCPLWLCPGVQHLDCSMSCTWPGRGA